MQTEHPARVIRLLLFIVVVTSSSRSDAVRTSAIDRAWQAYAHRIQREVTAHRMSASSSSSSDAGFSWYAHIEAKLKLVDASVARNAELASKMSQCQHSAASTTLDDEHSEWAGMLDDETGCCDEETTGQTISGGGGTVTFHHTPPLMMMDVASSCNPSIHGPEYGYSTFDEVLGHLVRDYDMTRLRTHENVVLDAVDRFLQDATRNHVTYSCLVLGSGTGGLVSRLATRFSGLSITATECSDVFFDATMFAFSPTCHRSSTTVAPWAANFGGVVYGDMSDQHALVNLQFPETDAFRSNIAFVRGDVLQRVESGIERGHRGKKFDLVITYYFLDAAARPSPSSGRGVLDVVDAIASLVQGMWINVGPLHYHSADVMPKLSVHDVIAYMSSAHPELKYRPSMNDSDGSGIRVLDEEDYARPQRTSLFIHAHRVFHGEWSRER